MIVKRPRRERQEAIVASIMIPVSIVASLIACIQSPNIDGPGVTSKIAQIIIIISVCFLITLFIIAIRNGMRVFCIDEKGITNVSFGKQGMVIPWSSFLSIERHIVKLEQYMGPDYYDGVLCSRIPLEIHSDTRLYHAGHTSDLYVEYKWLFLNKSNVIDLVLEEDQYEEFLSYIPQELFDKGIVKLGRTDSLQP
ncbi:MAG: hypothetical protein K5637_01010 [Lachnospiraceae bacterium]|nr:hypothetical protein [Lachnospiraceae bacterium]